jgi:hypothetical protein
MLRSKLPQVLIGFDQDPQLPTDLATAAAPGAPAPGTRHPAPGKSSINGLIFDSNTAILESLALGNKYLTPLLGCCNPSVWAVHAQRLFSVLIFALGRLIPGVGYTPAEPLQPTTPRGPGPRMAPRPAGQLTISGRSPDEMRWQNSVFDPTRLAPGMEQSDDPVLAFRPRAYAVSASADLVHDPSAGSAARAASGNALEQVELAGRRIRRNRICRVCCWPSGRSARTHVPCGSILFVPNVTRDRVQPGTRCAVDHTRSRRNTGTNLPAYAFDPVTKPCCRR